ncbi:MAG: GGDEF domain-containing protein, partial [Eubacterium sp.]|nr:GGDEF domain-containing protein [Eubacterium sp.]
MKKRITAAFLVSGLMDEFTIRMCDGVMSEAAAFDINLIVVPVKYIDRDLTGLADIYEYQYKTNAKNLLKENIDVLLVAADCIGCLTTHENLVRFMKALPDVPTVLIAARMDGYPGVTFDNKTGVREGLTYLVEKLGARRIGMLSGPPDYYDVGERQEAYMEIIRKYDLPWQETMVQETNLSTTCRPEVELFLDMNPDLDAVFCVNDSVAMPLYEALVDRGLEPGKDVKVMGFDNTRFAAMSTPSLSSVDADAVELGRHALRMVMRLAEGEKIGVEVTPTRFVLRESFGILSENDENADLLERANLEKQFDLVFYRYRDEERNDDSALRKQFVSIMEDVISYVKTGSDDRDWLKEILEHVDDFFYRKHALDYTDNDELLPFVDRLFAQIAASHDDLSEKVRVYRTMSSVYKSILKALSNRTVRYQNDADAMIYSMKTFAKDTLNFTYGNDQSYEGIMTTLLSVGIQNACVYIYDAPIVHLEQDEFELPGYVRVKAALVKGKKHIVPFNRQYLTIRHLFDHPFLPKEKWIMVLMPLYFGDTIYGSIQLDLTDIIFRNAEFLANQFATTARMIRILQQNNEIQKQLEENLAIMAENNIVLDRLSRNDVLTGILNRRGFDDISKGVIAECREMKRDVIISYVDMNNLKVINDRFGHDDGDFALKAISTLLTDIIGGNGTVGRIGGDE